MKITADNAKAIAILAGLTVAAIVVYKLYRGADDLAKGAKDLITKDLNPLSTENAVYRMFETRDDKGNVTGTLGSDIYDSIHHSDGTFKWPWEDDKGISK